MEQLLIAALEQVNSKRDESIILGLKSLESIIIGKRPSALPARLRCLSLATGAKQIESSNVAIDVKNAAIASDNVFIKCMVSFFFSHCVVISTKAYKLFIQKQATKLREKWRRTYREETALRKNDAMKAAVNSIMVLLFPSSCSFYKPRCRHMRAKRRILSAATLLERWLKTQPNGC